MFKLTLMTDDSNTNKVLNGHRGPWCTISSRQEGGTKSQDSLHGLAEVRRWKDHGRIRIKNDGNGDGPKYTSVYHICFFLH